MAWSPTPGNRRRSLAPVPRCYGEKQKVLTIRKELRPEMGCRSEDIEPAERDRLTVGRLDLVKGAR